MRLHKCTAALPLSLSLLLLAAGGGGAESLNPALIMEDLYEAPRFRIAMLDELLPASKLDETMHRLRREEEEEQKQQRGLNASSVARDPLVASAGGKWRFLCQVPRADSVREVLAAEAADRAQDSEKDPRAEERAAIVRGLALLEPLQGTCISYTSGWWTFEYCHNQSVRQYHRMLPDRQGLPVDVEYRLGEYSRRRRHSPAAAAGSDSDDDNDDGDSSGDNTSSGNSDLVRTTQIRRLGRKRFLAQVWAGGTMCDVTREPREVEIQYHCDAASPERIALVEETSVCRYAVVINTPRLCADPSFYDVAASTVFDIRCQQVIADADYDALMAEKSRLLHAPPASERGESDEEPAAAAAAAAAESSAAEGSGSDDEYQEQEEEDEDGDDSVPLALVGRRRRGLDGLPPKRSKPAAAGAERQAPQIVVDLRDPTLAGMTRKKQEALRRLLAIVYGDANLKVGFTSGQPEPGTEPEPNGDPAAAVTAAAAAAAAAAKGDDTKARHDEL
ncbi:Protein OS-9 [Coemansia javaensis]|uniref:Protein OS-9 homolog n=1 Tax=Coemansia javaensis TaxID=2761396 RepID=A0A9W8LFI7_9FUNG|nr:Protein OS-9 [Coemansia javaensis]